MSIATPLNWLHEFDLALPLFGHRNWIVVADSAYPEQSAPGIRTVFAAGDAIEVIDTVHSRLKSAHHVRPLVTIDAELEYLDETDAPGSGVFRDRLFALLGPNKPAVRRHEETIGKLHSTGQGFQVLVVKTAATIPYSTVFFELGCGYWNQEAEARLRSRMAAP